MTIRLTGQLRKKQSLGRCIFGRDRFSECNKDKAGDIPSFVL